MITMSSRPLRILVVDDDPAMVGAITALVGTEGHQVITAYDGLTAVKRVREESPDLVLLDLEPPRHEARVGATVLALTPTEYRLLEALLRAGGDVVPHLQLARAGWPTESDPDLLWLKPHLARLRSKLGEA